MRKLKHSDGMIYPSANLMPDFRSGHFQIDDVLNLFCRHDINPRISSDGYNVFFLKHHFPGRAAKRSQSNSSTAHVLICHSALLRSFRALVFAGLRQEKCWFEFEGIHCS